LVSVERFRLNFKMGGYNLEKTQVNNERLMSIILLITFAYCQATFSGKTIKLKGVARYVTRPTEPRRTYRRASTFSTGLNGRNWVDSLTFFEEEVEELISIATITQTVCNCFDIFAGQILKNRQPLDLTRYFYKLVSFILNRDCIRNSRFSLDTKNCLIDLVLYLI